jgi:Domain of unknown function (DUF4145)
MPYGDTDGLEINTGEQLQFARCPHCSTANPTISRRHVLSAEPRKESLKIAPYFLQWHVCVCESCAGLVSAACIVAPGSIQTPQVHRAHWIVPSVQLVSADIPKSAAHYLDQARETLSSASASVMMSASAVDAMLKERGSKDGSLYSRIESAEEAGVLTKHMADWAHDIRLDANDERHADEHVSPATVDDAKRCLEFADTLADLLFVLPARVKRGRKPAAAPTS